eukprot:gene37632-45717_t
MSQNNMLISRSRPDILAPLPNYLPYPYQKRPVIDRYDENPPRPQTAPVSSSQSASLVHFTENEFYGTSQAPEGRSAPSSAPAHRRADLSEKSLFLLDTDGDEFYMNQDDTADSSQLFAGLIDDEVNADLDVRWLLEASPAVSADCFVQERGAPLRVHTPYKPPAEGL